MKKNLLMIFVLCALLVVLIKIVIPAIAYAPQIGVVELTEQSKEPENEELFKPNPAVAIQLESLGIYKITAYCACVKCCGKTNGITASGVKAVEGVTVAADSRFPFGTKLYIGGHEYIVQDRGGAIQGNKIDIYFNTHQEALNFGVQYREVFVAK